MGIIDTARRLFGQELKASAAGGAISAHHVGQPVWTERRYDKIADEAYKRNAVAYACVKRIATGCASVRWLLHDAAGNEIESHKLLDLLNRPAPGVGGRQFLEAVYAYYLLAGNSYIEEVSPSRANAAPRELWALRPDRMKVVPGPDALPGAYKYEVGGRTVTWQMDPLKGGGPILHLKDFNPLDDWYGLSRIEAAAYGVDRHNAASAHNAALLQNGARPSGALIFKPVKGTNGEMQSAPASVIKAAGEELESRHTGPSNAGRPHVFGGDVAWESFGLSPRDMDFALGKDDAAWDVCLALGFPPILLVKGSATYNNVREAKLELWEETNLPLIEMLASAFNTWLTPRFGDGLKLSPDLDSISALEPRRESKRTSTLELVKAGIIDSDEGREALQFGPRPTNTVEKVDANVVRALVEAVPDAGYVPLIRYMRSVSLYPPGMTDEEILAEVRDLVGLDVSDEESGAVIGSEEDEDEGEAE